MRVTVFGTYDAAAHPRVGVIVEGLRAAGVTVTECNVPLGVDTASRVAALAQPWRLPLVLAKVGRCWWTLAARARRMPRPDVVLVGHLGHADIHLARRLFPKATLVLDFLIGARDTARDRGLAGPVLRAALGRLDDAALGAADVVVVDTEEHKDALPEAFRGRGVVVEVGAPGFWFDAADAGTRTGTGQGTGPGGPADKAVPLRVVFFGLYTPLQGTPVIGEALARLRAAGTRVEATMIGRGQDYDAARRAAGGGAEAADTVSWPAWVPSADLPRVVAAHDVCLGIFGTGPKALRVVPNKVFQGAAAGLAVVTSDTVPQRRALGAAAALVPPGDAVALADALAKLGADRGELARLRTASRALAEERFRPARVAAPLLARLEGRAALSAGGTATPEPPRRRNPRPS